MPLGILTQSIRLELDVIAARQHARQIAGLIGFDTQDQTRIATAVSEIVRNAFEYAGQARVEYSIDEQARRQSFIIRVIDQGPGIARLEDILSGKRESQSGEVSGILGAKRLMDRFEITSSVGTGTTVLLGKVLPSLGPKITTQDLQRISGELVQQQQTTPFQEIQQQNQELLQALEEVHRAHDLLEVRVQERTAELAAVNEALRAEIIEREAAENEIRQLNNRLEQRVQERTAQLEMVNKELEAFSYSVSHDLRAPLRNINACSKTLAEDYADQLTAGAQELLGDISAATMDMGDLIDSLLKLSRVTRSELDPMDINLSNVAKTIVSNLLKMQPERSVQFIIPDEITAYGDLPLLELALENILDNAWKFTSKKPHTRIEFGVQESNGEKVYFVRDNGAGFKSSYAHKLFVPFQRLHKASDFPGTGIGLATVHRIINRHGGRIWGEGETNEGATFYFTLSSPLHAK